MPTDRRYTSQPEDASGLYYYGARYYDPQLGQFISPDTIIPDPTKLIDYNRYLYARGNPVKYNDPTGHCPTPPSAMGTTICMALFIKPDSIPAGLSLLHGDGRDFQAGSDPAASRGYIWVSLDNGEWQAHMNPTGYLTLMALRRLLRTIRKVS
jgi:RHS repeat-associated protein